eukprot:2620078-Amphidinium_carterae.1
MMPGQTQQLQFGGFSMPAAMPTLLPPSFCAAPQPGQQLVRRIVSKLGLVNNDGGNQRRCTREVCYWESLLKYIPLLHTWAYTTTKVKFGLEDDEL